MMLVEKYRPKTWSDIVGNSETVNTLREIVEKGELNHSLFVGPPGVGKTSVAYVIARSLYGEAYQDNFLEFNASDERGIDVIRNQIKPFASSIPIAGNFKIILLDEADAMTQDAQTALRRIMEIFHSTTRFILTVNYQHKVINPIVSRCSVFHFKPLQPDEIYSRLCYIAQQEGFGISEKLMEVARAAKGDMRAAIMSLQSLQPASNVPFRTIQNIFESLRANRFRQARLLSHRLIENGISVRELLYAIYTFLLEDTYLSPKWKSNILIFLAETDYRITTGADPNLQLDWFLLNSMKNYS